MISPLFARFLERTRLTWLRCTILAVLGAAVRFPALSGEFVWDDTSLVRDNPFVKSPLLFLESFRHYLALDGSSTHYRPLQNISYFFDYLIWNADPFGYHLTNLLWHLGSALLLYFLLRRLLAPLCNRFTENQAGDAPFFIALLWVVHPVHSAAVDYISGRADSLGFCIACGAWLFYLKACSARDSALRVCFFIGAAILALAAFCSRETGVVWMLLFVVYLLMIDRDSSGRRRWITVAVCGCLVAIYAGLRQMPTQPLHLASPNNAASAERVSLMLRALGDYGRLMIFPTNLHVERSLASSSTALLSLLGILTATVLVCGALRKGKAQSIRMFGAAWFLLAYLPISNLFPLNATVAEHWLYLPSVGFLIFFVGVWMESGKRLQPLLTAVGCIAVIGLGARSFFRSGEWINPETLYRESLAAGSAKTRFVLNLAQTYAAEKNYAKAERLLRGLTASNPNYAMGQNALAHLLLEEGKAGEAEGILRKGASKSASVRPDEARTWIAALNLAYLKYSAHDTSAALVILGRARADYPGTWPLVSLESELLRETAQSTRALELVEDFRRDHWWHCAAAIEAGRIYLEQHRPGEAEAVLRRASWLDIHDAESLNLIAALKIEQHKLEAACQLQQRAVRRQPEQPQQYFLLSDVLEKLGRREEAKVALAQFHSLRALAKSQAAN